MLSLELNLGPEPLQVEPQHLGPVEAQLVFSHGCPDGTPRGTWPAWSARWTLGEEITL
jgi:maltooligosyltrehalose trehalohydrolase